ncbi:MAG: DNA cytosine methyltransferase [Pleurocapsa sp.]
MAGGKNRPIAVDLFAGAGGMSLGFEQAGFDVKVAVEVDPIHGAIHQFNFPLTTVLPYSVTELTGKDIRKLGNLGDRKIDVICGGAPCQGYSLMGKRALDDPRNHLVKDFLRIVLELQPSYFVFENVKGLTVGKHQRFLKELIAEFTAHGYRIRLPWQVLNAACYGVPQKRERLFLIGSKQGLPLPEYPTASTNLQVSEADSVETTDDLSLLPLTPCCWDAIGDLPEVEDFEELVDCDRIYTEDWGHPSNYAREMRCLDAESWHFGYRRYWNKFWLTSSVRTKHTEATRARFKSTKQGQIEPVSRFFRLDAHNLANTLRAGTDAARGAHTSPRPIHYQTPRCISVREMARLHGFPDWFQFHVTKWHGARQVGNSVPPPLARAIALEIMKCLAINPSKPELILDLGDIELLSLNMKQAASYWDVPVSIVRNKQ